MNFTELGLSKRIVAVLEKLGFVEPTEIQRKAIPFIVGGRDILASAETGSGKTAAYALPIIQNLKGTSERKPRCLVLVPTRELALQVQSQFERFSNNSGLRTVTVYGGTGYEKQTRLMRRGVDVIVATPGRLFDHIERGNADLSNIAMLVLDEADRMLDMGFLPQVRRIVDEMEGHSRQTLMFSATISGTVERIAAEFLKNPVTVQVNTRQVEPSQIEQRIYHIDEAGKDDLLVQLIKDEPEIHSVLVFTKTRRKAAKIRKKLCVSDITAEEIHGDISQSQREKTLARYREGRFAVLVATDIAARGLDIPAISHVVNYDLPMSAADYVHRIGRTGRAGRSGIALSFVCADQRHLMRDIEKVTGKPLDPNRTEKESAQDQHGHKRPRRQSRPRNASGSGSRGGRSRSSNGDNNARSGSKWESGSDRSGSNNPRGSKWESGSDRSGSNNPRSSKWESNSDRSGSTTPRSNKWESDSDRKGSNNPRNSRWETSDRTGTSARSGANAHSRSHARAGSTDGSGNGGGADTKRFWRRKTNEPGAKRPEARQKSAV
ncbi:MAG TPA: DEAD/DEAH box helicase [Drouetiella sp.]